MDLIAKKFKQVLEETLGKKEIGYYFFGEPYSLSNEHLNRGTLCVNPISTSIEPIATGVLERESFNIEFVLYKSMRNEVYKTGQEESGAEYLTRVMEGLNSDFTLRADTIRYVVRENFRRWGVNQLSVTITYDNILLGESDVARAVMGIDQVCLNLQLLQDKDPALIAEADNFILE